MNEKRKIILKEFEPDNSDGATAEDLEIRRTAEQHYWFGEPVTAKPGEVVEVSEKVAILALESGKFKYAPETVAAAEEEQIETSGGLPTDFPVREKLIAKTGELDTIEAINAATDEQILAIEGIGEKSLKQIREAAAKLGGNQ